MSELLGTVMAGARQVMKAQAINANNLANASTDGFRAELVHISSLEDVNGLSSSPDLGTGMVRTTGNPLDVSIDGEGWLAIQAPDGTEGYTRRGDLRVDTLGQMTNGLGQKVLGQGGPITLPPFTNVEIGGDGTVSIQPAGQPTTTRVIVDRLKLALPDKKQLKRGDDGVLRLPRGKTADADAKVRVQSGSLEGSNVNAVGEMLKMIDLSRQFEAQVKLMDSAKQNSSELASILKMN
ncbi:MAG TPA: flagellar basal body rod protein FlgF [Candidatus Acidoferrum sp.]|nr:flagellar basal body rod protein FlgF [Candidatus Acidoferrum sp.]